MSDLPTPLAIIRELGPQGMVSLRGDLSAPALKQAVLAACGHDVPGLRGMAGQLGAGVGWMSPDELLLLCDHAKAGDLAALLSQALAGQHHLALNVSDARTVFAIEGPGAREVIAKLSPVDITAGQFEPGEIRRTRLAQVPAAFWMADSDTIHLICFRSVSDYALKILDNAAKFPIGVWVAKAASAKQVGICWSDFQ